MKITITTTKKESKEIELPEFPFYLKGKDCAYKIIDEEKCVSITDFHFLTIEGNYMSSIPLNRFDEMLIISEEEFKEFYNMVLTKIEETL